MIVKNNWIETNIRDRLIDPTSKVKIHITPYEFEEVDFITASKNAANELKEYGKLYLALSGGADSDFVCRILHSQNVDFEAIVVVTPYNLKELQWAYKACNDLNIKPKIIEINEVDFFKLYRHLIYPINGNGIAVICSYLCGRVALANNSKLVTGVNIIGGDENGSVYPGLYEFDFYLDVFFGENIEIPFHLYSLEIVNETVKFIQNLDEGNFKSKLYQIDYREKMLFEYSENMLTVLRILRNKKKINAKESLLLEDKDILLKRFKHKGERFELPINLQAHQSIK